MRLHRCDHPLCNVRHLGLLHAACRQRRRAETNAARAQRRVRIVGNHLFVDRQARVVERFLGDAAVDAERLDRVDDHEVILGATGDERATALLQLLGQCARIRQHLLRIRAKRRLCRELQRHRDACDRVHVRPALHPGEHRLIDLLRELRLAENHAAARPAQRFVSGRRDDIEPGVERIRERTAGDQSADVRDVGHRQRADFIGDRTEAGIVELARIRRVAAQHDLRLHLLCRLEHAVVVDLAARRQRAIADEVEDPAHARHRRAVRQVAAMRKVHRENRVARLEARHVHGLVHRRAAQRLHVGVLGAEQSFGTLDRERFDAVRELLATVVAAPGVALGILVGEHAAVGRVDLRECVVLGRDQLDAIALSLLFALQGGIHVGIGSLDEIERDLHGGAPRVRSGTSAQASGRSRGRPCTHASQWFSPFTPVTCAGGC